MNLTTNQLPEEDFPDPVVIGPFVLIMDDYGNVLVVSLEFWNELQKLQERIVKEGYQ